MPVVIQGLFNAIKTITLTHHVHPNYIYAATERILALATMDNYHFFWLFMHQGFHHSFDQIVSFLEFLSHFDIVVPSKSFTHLRGFNRQYFNLFHQVTDLLLYIPFHGWDVGEVLYQIDYLSWFLEKLFQTQLNNISDRLQSIPVHFLQKLASYSVENSDCKGALAWMISQNYVNPLIEDMKKDFVFTSNDFEIVILGFQLATTYLDEQIKIRQKKINLELLMILQINDLNELCWSYLENDMEYFVRRVE